VTKIQSAKMVKEKGRWFVVVQTNERYIPYAAVVPRDPNGPEFRGPISWGAF
jgi:hypothetical protein